MIRALLQLLLTVCVSGVSAAPQAESRVTTPAEPSLGECLHQFGPAVELAEALARAPSPHLYNRLGTQYIDEKRLDCAIAAFTAGLQLAPRAGEVRYNLAFTLLKRGENRRAADQLRILVEQQPASTAAWNALGVSLQRLGMANEAAQAFDKALELKPSNAEASKNLAELLIMQGRHAAAVHCLGRALRLEPPAEVRFQLERTLADAYFGARDFAAASKVLERLVTNGESAIDDRLDLAAAYAHEGQYELALAQYTKVLQIAPGNDAATFSAGKMLILLNRSDEALPKLEESSRRKPGDFERLLLLGRACKGLERWEAAVEALQRATGIRPDNYEAHYLLGTALTRSGHAAVGIEELKVAVRLKPDAVVPRYEMARALLQSGDQSASNREFRVIQDLKRETFQTDLAGSDGAEGNQLFEKGRSREAAEAYRKALQVHPENARLHYNLALALEASGDPAGSQQETETAIRLDPNLAVAQNRYGLSCLNRGELAKAEGAFRQALAANPGLAEARNNLGVLYGRKGQPGRAISFFREAIRDNPGYVRAYVNLGLILASQGKNDEAIQILRRALEISPGLPDATTALHAVETAAVSSPP